MIMEETEKSHNFCRLEAEERPENQVSQWHKSQEKQEKKCEEVRAESGEFFLPPPFGSPQRIRLGYIHPHWEDNLNY